MALSALVAPTMGLRFVRLPVGDTIARVRRATPPAPGAAPATDGTDRTLERIERATMFDGKVNRTEHFESGQLVRVEEDTDGDGRLDKWETYANGALIRMDLDTSGTGKADRRLVYKADGSFDHIETDPTGSGVFRVMTP